MALTPTQSGLATLAKQMPVRNQAIADQQRAARMLQLQQAVAQLPTTAAPTQQQASQMASSMAAQAEAEKVDRAAKAIEETAQLAKLSQQEKALETSQQLATSQKELQQEQLNQAQRLSSLDDSAKRELFDSELQFKKDAANQTLFSERQLADYKRASARKEDDFKTWSQRSQQLHARNLQMLETINNRLEEALSQDYRVGAQKLDQQTRTAIAEMKRDNDMRIAKAKANAANKAAMWGALGQAAMVAGAAVTATGVGAPVGVPLMVAGAGASYYGASEAGKERV